MSYPHCSPPPTRTPPPNTIPLGIQFRCTDIHPIIIITQLILITPDEVGAIIFILQMWRQRLRAYSTWPRSHCLEMLGLGSNLGQSNAMGIIPSLLSCVSPVESSGLPFVLWMCPSLSIEGSFSKGVTSEHCLCPTLWPALSCLLGLMC